MQEVNEVERLKRRLTHDDTNITTLITTLPSRLGRQELEMLLEIRTEQLLEIAAAEEVVRRRRVGPHAS